MRKKTAQKNNNAGKYFRITRRPGSVSDVRPGRGTRNEMRAESGGVCRANHIHNLFLMWRSLNRNLICRHFWVIIFCGCQSHELRSGFSDVFRPGLARAECESCLSLPPTILMIASNQNLRIIFRRVIILTLSLKTNLDRQRLAQTHYVPTYFTLHSPPHGSPHGAN